MSSVFQSIKEDRLGWIWSSSQVSNIITLAWVVDFADGAKLINARHRTVAVRLLRTSQSLASSEFNREFAKIGQSKAAYLAEKRNEQRKAAADSQQQAAQNAASQQRSGDYENLYQVPRSSGISGTTWTASCKGGGDVVVTKRDENSLLCFWRNGQNNTRCEFVSVDSAARKACAD